MEYLSITNADVDDLEPEFEREFGGKWSFDASRRNVLIKHDDVQACPGSGKTTLVAAKLILLAKKWREKHRGVCVLTHTNVAKEEILQRLQKHPSGHTLLSYPHFIGTIQEFVNKFLGIPYCRSCEWPIVLIDDEKCVEVLEKSLSYRVKKFLENKPGALLNNFKVRLEDEEIKYDVPGFSKPSSSRSYLELSEKKNALLDSGFYYFSEMYAFAEKLLLENPDLKTFLQSRFPFVFVDEMQDTQKLQDDLLLQLFRCNEVVYQRFGDPDQAIFDGMNDEGPNESYNDNMSLVPIEDSHRFGDDIAVKIRGLSYRQLPNLRSTRNPPEGEATHTIFLYDGRTIEQVLPEFGRLAFDQLNIDSMTEKQRNEIKVKAVGSIGRENPKGLTIKHYWSDYDKSKTPKSFKAKKLIHIVKKCSEHKEGNVSENYESLLRGVLDLLRKANKKYCSRDGVETYYNKSSLLEDLKANHKIEDFRRLLTSWITSDFPDQSMWNRQVNYLRTLFALNGSIASNVRDFITYDSYSSLVSETEEERLATNIYKCSNGLEIEVATVHAVKGETHDATLILETKYDKYYDLGNLLEFFIDESRERPPEDHDHPKTKASLQAAFLKRLYVAASRPRHLLCLAIHKDRVSSEQKAFLSQKGWNICEL